MGVQLTGFDASQQQDMQTFDVLPPGDYLVITTECEQKQTKANDGSAYLNCVDEVLDGASKGRKVFRRLNLWNQNQIAVDIAQRELGAWCKAVGILKPNSTDELCNKPFVITLGVKAGKEQHGNAKEEQVVKGYK